jgi:hypothetical protein
LQAFLLTIIHNSYSQFIHKSLQDHFSAARSPPGGALSPNGGLKPLAAESL